MLIRNVFIAKGGVRLEARRVNMPLSDDGGIVSQLLVVGMVEFAQGSRPEPLTNDMQPVPEFGLIEAVDLGSLT